MSIFGKVVDAATGGLVKELGDLVKSYFPPDMSPEQKAELQIKTSELVLRREKQANDAAREAEESINQRIRDHEGTAADLKALPVIGPVLLMLRGAQRPIIGYATIWLDYKVFSGMWKIHDNEALLSCFYLINFLVLGFLFGERAIKNVLPVVAEFVKMRASTAKAEK